MNQFQGLKMFSISYVFVLQSQLQNTHGGYTIVYLSVRGCFAFHSFKPKTVSDAFVQWIHDITYIGDKYVYLACHGIT